MQFTITKRQKFVITSVILACGLIGTYFVPFYVRHWYILGLTAAAYLLSLWSLWVGISRLKAITLLILPTFFTLAVAGYYFLLISWITRIPAAIVFGVIFYLLLLSQNIFNVSSIRTIPLYRAASTTVYVLTILTFFLLLSVVLSFQMLFIWNAVIVFFLALPLSVQLLWSVEIERVDRALVEYSTIISVVTAELILAYSFWPIKTIIESLVTMIVYSVLLGVVVHMLRDRFSKRDLWLYMGWGFVGFLIALFTTTWTG